MFALSVQRSHVWPEEFVRRARQKIAIQGLHVDQPVRCIVHRIDKHQRAGGVRQFSNLRNRIDRSRYVRRISNGHELGLRRKFVSQIFHIQRAIAFANIHLPDHHAFFFQRPPRRDVGIMVQCAHYNLVARFQFPSNRSRQRKRDGGHVLPENNFIAVAIKKIRHRRARRQDHFIGSPAGQKCAIGIGVGS